MKDENTQPTSATDNPATDLPTTPPPLPAQSDPSTNDPSSQQPEAVADKMVTMSANDLSRLLSEAEERGFNRAASSNTKTDEPPEAGLYEEPDAMRPMPPGWKTSPLMAPRRDSIWDR